MRASAYTDIRPDTPCVRTMSEPSVFRWWRGWDLNPRPSGYERLDGRPLRAPEDARVHPCSAVVSSVLVASTQSARLGSTGDRVGDANALTGPTGHRRVMVPGMPDVVTWYRSSPRHPTAS